MIFIAKKYNMYICHSLIQLTLYLAWDILCSVEIIPYITIPIFKHEQGIAP
jgi:hypothetical protein